MNLKSVPRKMMIFVFDRVENPQCFRRAFHPGSLSRDCVVES